MGIEHEDGVAGRGIGDDHPFHAGRIDLAQEGIVGRALNCGNTQR